MGFSDLVKLKLRELEEPKFDTSLSGAHLHQPKLCLDGYNLFDGKLIDSDGKLIQEWSYKYLSKLLPNGNYLAQEHYESQKWGLFTWNDQLIWKNSTPIHHDLIVTPQNTILTFTKETHSYKGRDVDFCAIVEFDMKGKEIYRWSTWHHLKHIQKHHKRLTLDFPKFFFFPDTAKRKEKSIWGGSYDYYRLNSIQVIPLTPLGERDTRFQEGNWLVSFRHGSMIFILDKDTKEIVWKCINQDVTEKIEGQHSVSLLKNGNMLIFDNGRYRGWSRVIEINPTNYEILWEYQSDNFFTLSQGAAQRLPNENTLITESERGHAVEISKDKKIVWEYYHPEAQSEKNSKHPESFGKRQWIYRMTRYPKEFFKNLS